MTWSKFVLDDLIIASGTPTLKKSRNAETKQTDLKTWMKYDAQLYVFPTILQLSSPIWTAFQLKQYRIA